MTLLPALGLGVTGLECGDDAVLVGLAQIWMHDLAGELLGDGGAVGAAAVGVGRLCVEGHRVVDGGGDAGGVQLGLPGVAVLNQHSVLGEDAGAVGLGPGQRSGAGLVG